MPDNSQPYLTREEEDFLHRFLVAEHRRLCDSLPPFATATELREQVERRGSDS